MWTRRDLERQFAYAKAQGWLAHFKSSAEATGFDTAELMAIASRETNMRNIKGDFRAGVWHGYSLMQLDIGSHAAWISSGAWQDVKQAIQKGAEALAEKRAEIRRNLGKLVKLRGSAVIGKPYSSDDLRLITFAAYNSGIAAYYWFSRSGNADIGTTGKDYGHDVAARAVVFRELLAAESGAVKPAPTTETGKRPLAQIAAATASTAAVGAGTAAVGAMNNGVGPFHKLAWALGAALFAVALLALGFLLLIKFTTGSK